MQPFHIILIPGFITLVLVLLGCPSLRNLLSKAEARNAVLRKYLADLTDHPDGISFNQHLIFSAYVHGDEPPAGAYEPTDDGDKPIFEPRRLEIPKAKVKSILALLDACDDNPDNVRVNRLALWLAVNAILPETKEGLWAIDDSRASVLSVVETA